MMNQKRKPITTTRSSAAAGQVPASDNKVFVLVHGGFHGGWCWREVVNLLRARGHTVYTPTQTGCGERSHLLSASITLDTFIDDISNVLTWEDLHNVVLVGHSFGGSSISGVADRMPERISQLIYLDAVILKSGQTMFSLLSPEVVVTRTEASKARGGIGIEPPPPITFGIRDEAQAALVKARLTSHPFGTYTSPLNLVHDIGNGLPAVYVQCTDPVFAGLQTTREWVRASGMKTVDIKTGHDAMITAPVLLAELLALLGA
ncbi:MAG: alpha/beta fold hydrolase [Burkholderiaceae bacterium]|nr:alpha/beta fold hydrolase [Burkholderiaceae bacterium]